MKNVMKKILICFAVVMLCIGQFAALSSLGGTDAVALAESESALTIEGDFAWIGEYPQTLCTDEATITALNSVAQGADGYYTVNGDRYAKCVAEIGSGGGGKYSDDSTPVSGETKYFKVEPLKWIVLDKNESEDMLMLISYQILDTHAWQTQYTEGVDVYPGRSVTITVDIDGTATELPAYDWQYSEMRSWLNGTFYDNAFDTAAKRSVLKVTTPAAKTTSEVDTDNFVGLLCADDFTKNVSKIKDTGATDYAIAQGLSYDFNEYKFSNYWLNSPAVEGSFYFGYRGYVASSRGYEIHDAMPIDFTSGGVRPVIYVGTDKAEVVLTDDQKEDNLYDGLKIGGIVLAVVGVIGVAVAVILDKKHCKENGIDYKTHKPGKKFVAVFAPALAIAVIGMVMFAYPVVLNGGFSGFGGAPAPDGIYVQIGSDSGDGWVQVGLTAYKFDSNGTVYYTDYYDGGSTNWRSGTWTQSGSNITVTFSGTWGFTVTCTINSSGDTLSYNGKAEYKKQT
ncbi:MAG: hypothetical protein BWX72_01115 [Firmicutes bacterium ADurb.Bin080]|nr:MAG: hypothetical protein BWX72_01115 [Firmicutes bacterium ADurb.Bin080]